MAGRKKNQLTPKQKRFCDEYLIDLNATQAAIRAGYSKKTADTIAGQLLDKTWVSAYIQLKIKEREKRTEITQDKVLQELARIGFADIKDFVAFRTEKTQVAVDDEGKPVIGYDVVIDVKDSDRVDGHCISEIGRGKDGSFKFKLHDKIAALDKMGKHLGVFKEDINVGLDVSIKVSYGDENATAEED